ncbi:helix-turn-helix domain-containing protein [Aquibacillus kalidii]|uniref:helix-turn-helix domain-containing protein n=1 Tax=Aquibacillus kalidii TaxID=2762597 RepID=UPI001647378D|nr:helix-turn-helix domain-containing protein [Aquibacillus kalidii]
MQKISKQTLNNVIHLVSNTFHLPVILINSIQADLQQIFPGFTLNPIYATTEEYIAKLTEALPQTSPIHIVSPTTLENIICIDVLVEGLPKSTLCIGPSIYSSLENNQAIKHTNETAVKPMDLKIEDYYNRLPVINQIELINIAKVIYFMLFQQAVETIDIVQQHNGSTIQAGESDLELSKNRQEEDFHHDWLYEIDILHCIKEGNKETLLEKLFIPPNGRIGTLSKTSPLRDQKNLAISLITLATRSAMEGGLNPELAYTMSDIFIQNIEELNDKHKVRNYMFDVLIDFADRVKTSRKKQYSRVINTCMSFIFKHLYNEITLSQLAAITEMNSSYLSTLFKKEVGISLSSYIQKERIEEAKSLLLLTSYSLTDICSLLQFSDQSYFTKVFKDVTGLTPKKYRVSLPS